MENVKSWNDLASLSLHGLRDDLSSKYGSFERLACVRPD
jgi:hypothetical protein